MNVRVLRKNNKGMTLVEVIISIALFGIISMIVVTVFTSGILLASKSGDNTKVTGNAGGVLENVLGGSTVTVDGSELQVEGVTVGTGVYSEDDTIEATIVYNGGSSEELEGVLYTIDSSSDRNETSMRVFVPD